MQEASSGYLEVKEVKQLVQEASCGYLEVKEASCPSRYYQHLHIPTALPF